MTPGKRGLALDSFRCQWGGIARRRRGTSLRDASSRRALHNIEERFLEIVSCSKYRAVIHQKFMEAEKRRRLFRAGSRGSRRALAHTTRKPLSCVNARARKIRRGARGALARIAVTPAGIGVLTDNLLYERNSNKHRDPRSPRRKL